MEKNKILDFLKSHGPSLPLQISKDLGVDTIFASAHLSELKEHGHIKISSIKIGGGSPLYYLPGQEHLLQKFSENLGEKQKKIYDILKQKIVVKDSSLVPVFRAAVRTLKDFAQPITVNTENGKELFWKWVFATEQDAEKIVKKIIGVSDTKKDISQKKHIQSVLKKEKPKVSIKKMQGHKTQDKSTFHHEILSYFSKNKIKVNEENIIRKLSDIEFIVEVPSSVGTLKYFVKAKSKKKINDGDLSSVFVVGQAKRLPVIYLSKGDLTKKAKTMLDSEFKGMKFNKL